MHAPSPKSPLMSVKGSGSSGLPGSYGSTKDGSSNGGGDRENLLGGDSAAPLLSGNTTSSSSLLDVPLKAAALQRGGGGGGDGGAPQLYSPLPAGGGVSDPTGVAGIERLMFVAALKKNRDRIRHCRTVPFSVLTYALYATALLLHVTIGLSYDFEAQLISTVPIPTNPRDFLAYLQSDLLPAILPNTNVSDTSGWRRIHGNVMVVGGVRVLMQRRARTSCPLAGPVLALYGSSCGSPTDMSLDTNWGNPAAAEAYNASSAFYPSTVPGDPAGARFQLVLDPTTSSDELNARVQGLIAGGWIDNFTASADVQFAALNGEAGLYGRASLHVAYSLGSMDAVAITSTSVAVDPYFNQQSLIILDVLIMLYWVYLVAGTTRRVKEALFPRNRSTPWRTRLWRLSTSYWRLLDIATVLSMMVTFITWWVLVAQLKSVVSHFSANESTIASVEQDIFNAATVFGNFKVAAVCTLAALTLRLFKYFAYQPRLAVISESISRGCGDALHFTLLISVLVIFFCIWGYFMFGTQVRARGRGASGSSRGKGSSFVVVWVKTEWCYPINRIFSLPFPLPCPPRFVVSHTTGTRPRTPSWPPLGSSCMTTTLTGCMR